MSPDASLERAKAAMESGLLDEALSIAQERETRELANVNLHLGWANVLEDLGLPDQAALELNLAIRDAPQRADTYQKLSEIYLDMGQASRAAKTLSRLVERYPDRPEFYEQLANAFKEAREFDHALQVYQNALERTQDNRFKAFIRDMSFVETQDESEVDDKASVESIVPSKHDLITFCNLFASREGVYARQWLSPTGESGYTPVNEPLNIKVAENHILGNFTIGSYPVRLDNTVNFMAFDFDVAKFALKKAITSERLWANLMRRVLALGCRLLDICASNDIPAYLEDSGFKGYHVWVFMESPVPAGVAKKCGDLLIAQINPMPQDITVEVFPKQTTVKSGGLGNLIKLPLGIHRKTGKRSLFVSPNAEPYTDQLAVLQSVQKAPKRSIYATIQRLNAPSGVPPRVPKHSPSVDDVPFDPDEMNNVSAHGRLPREIEQPYDMDRDPEFQLLMLKCPVIKHIVDKVNQTGLLSKDETLVLIHTVGHLKQGPQAVNSIFQRCINADASLFMKSQLKGNPVSCPKIRLRIPDVTSALPCNCAFDMAVNLYPTPVIHIRGLSGSAKMTPLGITVDSLQFQNLVQDYIKLRKQLRETQLLLTKYEAKLEEFFDEAGINSAQTPLGEIKMRKEPGIKTSFSLEI